MDRADPLAHRRDLFVLPEGIVYLDGHSLGPAARSALAGVEAAARTDWAQGLIRSWNAAGWIDLPNRIGDRIARLIGAEQGEVLMCDSVSVNLFKLAAAALPQARTRRVAVEADEFPTDIYVAGGLGELADAPVAVLQPGELDAELARGGVVIKSAVNYRSAEVTDMAALEAIARDAGGLIVWDLSYAAGVLALDLRGAAARLAVGCTYKYLNGGPGAPAYAYVARELADRLETPIRGWFGDARAFAFEPAYAPAPGIARFAAGTPGILSAAALDGALEAFEGLDPGLLQAKSRALGAVWLDRALSAGLKSGSPRDAAARGGHVTLLHDDGYAIVQALIARGVIGDFRAPNAMRFGFSPLYLGFAETWRAFDVLDDVLTTGVFRDPKYAARARVT